MISAGLKNREIELRRAVRVSDGQGGFDTGDSVHTTFRGRIRPASPRETENASRRGADVSHVAYCDYRTDIVIGDNLVDGDLSVRVVSIRNPGGMNHHLEIDCVEVQSAEGV